MNLMDKLKTQCEVMFRIDEAVMKGLNKIYLKVGKVGFGLDIVLLRSARVIGAMAASKSNNNMAEIEELCEIMREGHSSQLKSENRDG